MTETEPPAPAPLPHEIQRVGRVGAELRRVFDDAVAEPLPQAFEDLLQKLK